MILYEKRPFRVDMLRLGEGERGVLETCAVMRALVNEYKVDPEIRALTLSLVGGVPEKDSLAEIEKLFFFVRDSIRYVQDIWDVETLHTPPELLRIGQGDCDDKATLLATMLESIGYETSFKVAGYHGPDFEHVYVFVRSHIDGIALHLDPTEPVLPGWEAPNRTVEKYVQ